MAVLLATAGCATSQEKAQLQPPKGPALTPEAQQMLACALEQKDASGFVVNLAAMEELGLGRPAETLKRTVQLFDAFAPWLATEEDDPELQQFLGRVTVASAILREWTDWPSVRGLALSVPDVMQAAQEAQAGEAPVRRSVVVLALAHTQESNQHLLEGVMALGRAALADEQGGKVQFELQGADACLVDASGPPFCVRPGNGYLLMGAPEAMSAYQAKLGAPAQAAGSGSASVMSDLMLLRARISMHEQGSAELVLHGRQTLTLEASLQTQSPVLLARAEQAVTQGVQSYDQRRAQQRQLLQQSLQKMQAQLAADPKAPEDLKKIAATLTPEKVMDPHGWWQQMRTSFKAQRTNDQFALSLTVPAGAVNELQKMIEEGGGSSAASLGVIAAIAVPNFLRFQCRAKQSEVRSNLKAIYSAQKSYAAEKGRYGQSFEQLGFQPFGETRYTYCMGQQCLRCTASGCDQGLPPENPCEGMSGVGKTVQDGFQVCAFANLDSDNGIDTWVVDDRGQPEQGENDCAE